MKKYFALMIFVVGNAIAQPTSIAGITPGKTTIDELRGLADADGRITKNLADGYNIAKIKGMNGKSASVLVLNGVVYKIDISLGFGETDLIEALVDKYGKPSRTIGGIDKVICQNKLGAKFERYQGVKKELWPEKDGVQALIQWRADECDYAPSGSYVLYHVKTVSDMESAKKHEEDRIKGDKMNKLKESL